MHVGDIIHKIRKENHMTLVELSEKSKIALATLSRMENGKMTGTLKSHMRICEALGISLPDLYKELPSQKKKLGIQKKSPEQSVSVYDKKVVVETLASNVDNKKMMPAMIRISKNCATETEETSHGTEKIVYVIEGKIDAKIGEGNYNLNSGDTIYFDSSVPHSFKNESQGETRLLCISSKCPKK